MTDETTPEQAKRPRLTKPSELDLEQQIADLRWTMGEREWQNLYGDSDD